MSWRVHGKEKISLRVKLVIILLVGALSMFFAEVCSGSSIMWFTTLWAWIITFWLYLAHILLFINLAFIFKRTSFTSLYLWGVLFGLYESWITKVAWAGYMGSSSGMGTFLGFAFPQFPLIVFFWHPIMSFIVPILTFEVLSGKSHILPEHISILTKSRRNWLLAFIIVFMGALFLSFNAKGNIFATDLTILGSIIIIAVLWIVSRKYAKQFSIKSLRLGKTGITILLVYLALLYSLTFVFILPERIAPPLTISLTLGIYGLIGILLYLDKTDGQAINAINQEKRLFELKELAILLVLFSILATILSVFTPATFVIVALFYLVMSIVSPVLLIRIILNVVRGMRKRNMQNM